MGIPSIGNISHYPFSDIQNFSSTTSFLEYDIILLDFLQILNEYLPYSDHKSSFSASTIIIDFSFAETLKRDATRRQMEIEEFLKLGRTLFVFTPPPINLLLQGGKYEQNSSNYELRRILPTFPSTKLTSGSRIEFVGDPMFRNFWNDFNQIFTYTATYKDTFGSPIFKVAGTNNYIGSHIRHGGGNIVFLPRVSYLDEDKEELFLESLVSLSDSLKNDQKVVKEELPEWSHYYLLPQEMSTKHTITKYEKELEDLKLSINKTKEKLQQIEQFKLLFTSTGTVLERQVAKVFESLGFEVTEGIPGRDDLILKYKEHIAVVEVKGVAKSAAEKHAAQLEKWVSEYITQNNVLPKGILVVNAFKDFSLDKRTENAFPDQMLNYCKNRNHCLLTGLDLLSIYLYVSNNPEKKEEIIESMLATSGAYDKLDWKEFVQQDASVSI